MSDELEERRLRALPIIAHPEHFAICNGCESIIVRHSMAVCSACKSYNFDTDEAMIIERATYLAARPRTVLQPADLS